MKPYYDRDGIVLYHAQCEDILPTLPAKSADLVLTDPPYAEQTHTGARTLAADKRANNRTRGQLDTPIDFDSITLDELRGHFDRIGRLARAWVVATMDWRHCTAFESVPPESLEFVRFGVWVKPNGAPQMSGDRPGAGWEAVAHMHQATRRGRMRWNGGGRHGVYTHHILHADHRIGPNRTEKPLPLWLELMRLFSNPGDLVLDPFCGDGTTAVAARLLGRRAICIDRDERGLEACVRYLERITLLPTPAQRQPLFAEEGI